MNGFINLQHPLLQALGLTVLHSLWQGILIYFLLQMISSFIPVKRSGLRYGLAYGALGVLFLLFFFTFFSAWQEVHNTAHAMTITAAKVAGQVYSWQQVMSFQFASLFKNYLPFIAVIYAIGVLGLCGKMIWEIVQLKYLRRQVMLPDSLLQERFLELRRATGIRKDVLLRVSQKVKGPLMFGFLKPLILLPLSVISRMDMQQLESILLHELAHIKRNDYLWNLLQMVMETLLFFNPVAWYLSARVRREREHRCDDYVLQHTASPLPYAYALLALEENRTTLTTPVMAATGNTQNFLLNRIKRITTMNPAQRNSHRTLASVSVLVLLAAMVCFATAFGQETQKDGKPEKVVKSYSRKVTTVTDDQGHTRTTEHVSGDTSGMAEVMKAIPLAMHMAGNTIKETDWDEIGTTIETAIAGAGKSMDAINWDSIQFQVKEAVRSARASAADVDWNNINAEMEQAKTEMARAMKEMDVAMENIDWTEMQGEIGQAKEEMKKAKVEMKKAKVEMKKTKIEMKKIIKEQGQEEGAED